MASFNKVILMGNLTRDPELRSTPGGAQLAEITLAVNDVYTDKSGAKQERVDFIDITFWGKQAETLCRWKKKGDPLLVEGSLRLDKWQDKETGQNRSKLRVQGQGFTFVGRAGGGDGGGGGGGGGGNRGGNQGGGGGGYNRGGGGGRAPQGGGGNQGGGYDGPPPDDNYGGYDGGYATSLPEGGGEEPPF
jgi:single-strand DNA-binding protein